MAIKTDQELKTAGFTDSGLNRYKKTVEDYCEEVYVKAVALGDRDKASNSPREVTHEHVRDAASDLQRRGRESKTPTQVWCQIGEYVCAATAGVGAGKLETTWGIALFGLSLTIGVVLFIVRNQEGRGA